MSTKKLTIHIELEGLTEEQENELDRLYDKFLNYAESKGLATERSHIVATMEDLSESSND